MGDGRHKRRPLLHSALLLSRFGTRRKSRPCSSHASLSSRTAVRWLSDNQYAGATRDSASRAAGPLVQQFKDQADAIFASNTRGPFLVSREALKWMRRKRTASQRSEKIEAKIINMGSLGGLRPWPTHAHYCSSKAALHMLTKVMAKALAPEIAVNAVAPGMIDLGEKSAAAFMRRMAKQTPMLRNGRGDEIAAAVLFFATAPQFITGQILAVDGGLGL